MATQRRQGPRASPWRRLPPFRPAGARRRRLTPDTVGCHELADPMCPHWGWRGDARVPVEPLAAGRAGLGAPGGRSACCRPPASRRRSRTRRRDGVSKGITPLQRSWALPPGIDVHGSDPTGGGGWRVHTRDGPAPEPDPRRGGLPTICQDVGGACRLGSLTPLASILAGKPENRSVSQVILVERFQYNIAIWC